MRYTGLAGTCSMAEINSISSSDIKDLPAVVSNAQDDDQQAFIANLSDNQHKVKGIRQAFVKVGFRKVGTYYGNSSQTVHVYMKGVTLCQASKKRTSK